MHLYWLGNFYWLAQWIRTKELKGICQLVTATPSSCLALLPRPSQWDATLRRRLLEAGRCFYERLMFPYWLIDSSTSCSICDREKSMQRILIHRPYFNNVTQTLRAALRWLSKKAFREENKGISTTGSIVICLEDHNRADTLYEDD